MPWGIKRERMAAKVGGLFWRISMVGCYRSIPEQPSCSAQFRLPRSPEDGQSACSIGSSPRRPTFAGPRLPPATCPIPRVWRGGGQHLEFQCEGPDNVSDGSESTGRRRRASFAGRGTAVTQSHVDAPPHSLRGQSPPAGDRAGNAAASGQGVRPARWPKTQFDHSSIERRAVHARTSRVQRCKART